ncbi:MAG: S9 family peptidase [Bacteroidales bacterium]|nr:S9 family peptidase [Bacteroidales bacterium]
MKKLILSLLVAIPAAVSAQEGVTDIHPANPEGKLLTMQETILSRTVWPERKFNYEVMSKLEADGIFFRDTTKKPQARTIAGSLYYYPTPDAASVPVAISQDKDIRYGESVSRNEFGIDGGIFWSPDGKKLAFFRKDESLVTEFPLLDISTRTGSLKSIKYPMNGMESERVSLGVFDTESRETIYLDVTDFGADRYLTNISWGPDGKNIFALVVDRSQKHMKLNQYRSADGSFVRTILTEDNDKYVEPLDPLYFTGSNYHFVYRTANRDGYRSLYLCDTLGTIRRITGVNADVEYIGFKNGTLFYTSAEVSPVENHLFKISITPAKGKKGVSAASAKIGKPVRLTAERGWHSIRLSTDGKYFLDAVTNFNLPADYKVVTTDGKAKVVWADSSRNPLEEYKTGEIDFGHLASADGKYQNWYRLYKPADFDPAKKYPVILYVYGGPHSQMVQDKWLGNIRMWELYMAQRGYVVFVMDNRGTQNQGLEYEQAIHKYCGKAEMEDQMVGINMLKALPWVDSDRIGVHGWSYGGFMTISLLTTYPDVFKVGVAGGPVIDWKWYEIMYGERYMETAVTNPDGFAQTSLIKKAKNLKGKLLICQGAIDNTCVWEHSLSFIQECIANGIQVDYFPYPRAEHNVIGPHRVHLMDKVSLYFDNNL